MPVNTSLFSAQSSQRSTLRKWKLQFALLCFMSLDKEGDKEIPCADCKVNFVFSKGEQDFYDTKGFTAIPTCYKPCREAKKARTDGGKGKVGQHTLGTMAKPNVSCYWED